VKAQRVTIRCDLCSPRRPGLIWLGGADWVECPQCVDGKVEAVETKVEPRGRVFIAGDTRGATLHHPLQARRFG
jgi:hypothetical protein